jgi:carbon-monoxide dehydrogenase small subunit
MKKIIIRLTVNGEDYELYIPANRTLLEVLREELELTGTKEGCGEGACGSCTVLGDTLPMRSCLTLAAEVQDLEIQTVEGLKTDEKGLDRLQEAFINHGAVQCGFCTPGMLMSARAFLDQNPEPDEKDIRYAISGNICRCTGYAKIVDAILDVAAVEKAED